jgi:hypothetical protein
MRLRNRPILLPAAGGLLLLDLFLSWQRACADTGVGSICASRSGWHGIGALVGILTLALFAWEAFRLSGRAPELPVSADLLSGGLAAATATITAIEFLTHNQARHWPAWIGLILAILVGAGAWQRFNHATAQGAALQHGS